MASGSQNMTTYKAKQLVNTYGSDTTPVYINAGVPTILGTIGANNKPVWVNNGVISILTTIGANNKPVWINEGVISTLTTIGDTTKPVWINNGVITEMTAGTTGQFYRGDKAWSNDLNGTFYVGNVNLSHGDQLNMTGESWDGFAFNYTSHSSKTDGQSIRFYDGKQTEIMRLSKNGSLAIGSTNSSYKLYVNGTSYFNGNTTHNGIDYFANGTTYYINNSGTGKLNALTLAGLLTITQANAALGIATTSPYKIGTAKWNIHIKNGNGSGTGVNDGYASAITFGDGSAYAGIYYQSSGSYGSRLIFGTTNGYANGAYARMIINHSGYVGIGTMTPDQLLHVNGKGKFSDRLYTHNWIEFDDASGLYLPSSGSGTHFYPANDVTYGSFEMQGTKNGYRGITMGVSNNDLTIMSNGNDEGLYNATVGRWPFFYHRSSEYCSIMGTSNSGWLINLCQNTYCYGAFYSGDIRGSNVRLTSNWVGFYQNANAGGNRYGYIQCNVDRMYFVKENSSSQNEYFYFYSRIYCPSISVGYTNTNYYLSATNITTNGSIVIQQPAASRRNGIIGTYDQTKAAAIWSMGTSYQIAADGSGLGSLYGAAYGYQGQAYLGSQNYAGGHQFLWCQNGTVYVALGNNLWVRNTVYGTFSGNLTGNVTGNCSGSSGSCTGNAAYLPTKCDGGQKTNPQTYFSNTIGLRVAMTGSWSVWSDTLWINGYSGGDVKNMCALHFLRNGTPRMAITTQQNTASAYGTYYEFITTYNWANQTISWAKITDRPTLGPIVSQSAHIGGKTVTIDLSGYCSTGSAYGFLVVANSWVAMSNNTGVAVIAGLQRGTGYGSAVQIVNETYGVSVSFNNANGKATLTFYNSNGGGYAIMQLYG